MRISNREAEPRGILSVVNSSTAYDDIAQLNLC